MTADGEKRAAAEAAARLVQDGMIVGLGTGSTAAHFLDCLGERMQRDRLRIEGVPTSEKTAQHARRLGIPLLPWEKDVVIDYAADGADEVDPQARLIKGLGGALLREKKVAKSSRDFAVMIDASKLVPRLGTKAPVPVEVQAKLAAGIRKALESLGARPILRESGGQPFFTDNGNWILDAWFEEISNPERLEEEINAIEGVLENGIFVGLTHRVFVGEAGGAREWKIPAQSLRAPGT
ncbi:MAG TPA: ribose-5-phosphate isomerase RpiA [bacterium]|nr:ribose-5-phosphate isomerase RpiA [bacterium]